MRVVFNCTFHNFHREYCESIAEEIARRDGEAIFADGPEENSGRYEVDFCIQPDEACERLGDPNRRLDQPRFARDSTE